MAIYREGNNSIGDNEAKKTILPNDYFAELKSRCKKIDLDSINADMQVLISLAEEAKELGQVKLAKNYKDLMITYAKERIMLKNGYSQYVHKEDIERFIQSVNDRCIKICEFKNFPRSVPVEVKEAIKKVKKLNVFDDLWVVFIDYNTFDNLTKEEKETRSKNRDPILFGTCKEYMDRFYFIIDWEDDVCDLRFTDMIKALKKLDNKYQVNTIIKNPEKYIQKAMLDSKKTYKPTKRTKSIWSKIANLWK